MEEAANGRAGAYEVALAAAIARLAGQALPDNSVAWYQLGDAAALDADRAALEREPAPDPDAPTEARRTAFAEQVATKSLLYSLLADERSRELLVLLGAYAVLGRLRVRLPYFDPEAPARRAALVRACERAEDADPALVAEVNAKWSADRFSLFDLSPAGRAMTVYSITEELFRYVESPSYHCPTPDGDIRPGPGDVALDCGAAFGDVSLQFAAAVGEAGHVLCFEPYHLFLRVFAANMALNPGLAGRVSLVERGVWDKDGETLSFIEGGGGSCIDESNTSRFKIATTTLDTAVAQAGLDRVDFVKMDIEGAELRALKGAEGLLRRFRPRLAVCLYHYPQDFHEIPAWLDSLGLGYRFYLNHHHVNEWETVLYATAPTSD